MVREDPYTLKELTYNPGNRSCGKKCDSCDNFVDAVTLLKCHAGKVFQIRKPFACTSKNIIYLCYCTNCNLQGVGSTVNWKARLANYKSHVKKNVNSCSISTTTTKICYTMLKIFYSKRKNFGLALYVPYTKD